MQQFTVPQFIDVEDKIIGPVTTRQFLIMLVAGLIVAVLYKIFYFTAFLIVSLLVVLVFGTVAFVRINGRPFHYFILNFLQTLKREKLRVWQIGGLLKEGRFEDLEDAGAENIVVRPKKKYTKSRLNELSLIVDTQGAYQGGEENQEVLSHNGVKDLELI